MAPRPIKRRTRAITPGMRRRQARKEAERLLMDDSGMTPENEREQRELMLAMAAANQQNRFTSPATQQRMKEDDPRVEGYIEDTLFKNLGYDGDSVDDPWSAATVSDLAKAFDPEFKGSVAHAEYINRAFQEEGNYEADKIGRKTDFMPGDILFKGRSSDERPGSPKRFGQFKRRAKEGDLYASHSDIITGTGVDEQGKKYYELQGGNMGDSLYTRRMYADALNRRYAGRLTQ